VEVQWRIDDDTLVEERPARPHAPSGDEDRAVDTFQLNRPTRLAFLAPVVRRVLERAVQQALERRAQLFEARIDRLVDVYLDEDPFADVERRIDDDNAVFRARYLAQVPCLTSQELHRRRGGAGRNTSQLAASWKRQGRVFAVTHRGRDLFPSFQFDDDGTPRALMAEVLRVLPTHFSPWQRAAWFAAANPELDGDSPADRIRAGDRAVIDAARLAAELPAG